VPYLRRDEVLPGNAVVIMGGSMGGGLENLQEKAETEFQRLVDEEDPEPVYGLSVCSLPNMTAEQIAEVVGTENLPHPRMQTSTVATLEALGYEVVPSEWHGHATLVLPGPPDEPDWQNLQQAFSAPIDNPVARSKRTRPT
jgi:hypothetical protein